MTIQKLNNATEALRFIILDLIATHDLTKDREARQVLVAIEDAVRSLNLDMEEVVPPELVRGYFKGFEDAGNQLGIADVTQIIRADGTINPVLRRQIHINALNTIVEDTMMDLGAAYRTFGLNAVGSIENALGAIQRGVAERIVTGRPKDEIAKRVQQAFLKEGQTAFITRDGKSLPLDIYSKMVVNTKLAQADADGHLNRYTESDVELVEIITNDPTCEHCAAYRGMVYSLNSRAEGFESLPPNLLPQHPNCQCTYVPIALDYLTNSEREAIDERVDKGVDFNIRDKKEIAQYEHFQNINRRNNAEKKLYSRMQTELGADMPDSLGAFRRMKRAKTSKYQELYSNYLSATHSK